MKTCFKCHAEKPLTEFYKHSQMADGHLNKCKECTKADVKAHGADRGYDKRRNSLPHRVKARKDYQQTERGRALASASKKRFTDRNPHKKKATSMVSAALRNGSLEKSDCESCGNPDVQGHHEDYSRPLDVVWLCVKCHSHYHRVRRALERKELVQPL